MKKLLRWLKRLLGIRPRWFEVSLTRVSRRVLKDLCADGDFAAKSNRPNPAVKELTGNL